jgi:hypothetical protein
MGKADNSVLMELKLVAFQSHLTFRRDIQRSIHISSNGTIRNGSSPVIIYMDAALLASVDFAVRDERISAA